MTWMDDCRGFIFIYLCVLNFFKNLFLYQSIVNKVQQSDSVICVCIYISGVFQVAQKVKNLPAVRETRV